MGEMLTGALLARRYARSEIDRDEYLQKRSDILGLPGHATPVLNKHQPFIRACA